MAALVAMEDVRAYLQSQESMEAQFEEDVARNPYSIETWTSYLNLLHTKPSGHRLSKERVALFRRALSYVPLSYKLWKRFLDESYALVRGLRIDRPELVELTLLYEDALVHLHKMPRIWLQYLSLLDHLRWGTRTRRVFDRALRALPITQHKRIWGPYLAFIHAQGVASTAIRVYRRFLMFDPSGREEYVRYLLSMELWEEASIQLVHVLNQPHPPSSRHALWMELCSLISSHPDDISSALNVDAILRSGVHLFSDEVGRFWCALATYYMRLGMFESARDVYEEGLAAVLTVRDFSLIFDAYVKFLEALVTAEMQDPTSPELSRTLHLYEDLAERRPLLLNAVYLRQNPHSVAHWHQRIALTSTSASTTSSTPSPILIVQTYTEALKTIDSTLAVGALSSLWISFASFYEAHNDVANARAVFEKARHRLASSFRSLDERAAIVCAQIELELRHGAYDAALEFARAACRQKPVMRSLKLWHLRVDLEESLGDVPSTRSAYEHLIDLKLATPVLVLQFTAYLETHEYFEDAFHVYEKAVQLFPAFPHAKPIWTAYLAAFTHRYQGTKLERARDLYDQVLNVAPVADMADFYKQYAALEEKYGLWRNAQTIYEQATTKVESLPHVQLELYQFYIKKAQQLAGVVAVRAIYERAMGHLPNETVWQLGLEFCRFETLLGELHRARAIYAHIGQCCDPRQHEDSFWSKWHAFEIEHGNEETFLDMLRIKRSVQMLYATVNYIGTAAGALNMVASSTNQAAPTSITSSSTIVPGDAMETLEKEDQTTNDEEIDIDEQPVPEAVVRGKVF
ncbi:hypothetical protein H257_13429 [Aphanomyces astaci]|uniref:Suppressor of forked domain-containing protein n=1 Tax=Aphanomyces astaci TaxID=112090 RepID=W4FUX7_APHAT|nr:hypothetical protein H257_13429 [Aphanomyces astaci]ETV71297.1 hypothetical protein H257_13429 [Aphanomyces astaci]|eukprot:XP_009839237.1 hypothetical protein H257_13429 [Aphanomyces astaci]